MPKFDVVIGNPPYNNNIHLSFLEKAYEISNRHVVLVHPAMWLYAQKPGNASSLKSRADRLKKKIDCHFKSFTFFNANRSFGVGLFGPCAITEIDKQKTANDINVLDKERNSNETYNHLNFNPFFDNSGVFDSIKTKIWNYCIDIDNLQNNIEYGTLIKDFKKSRYYLNIPYISGHVSKDLGRYLADDFYQLIYKSNKTLSTEFKTRDNNTRITGILKFDNEFVGNNSLDYLANSKLAKFALMIVKLNYRLDRGELKYVPFFDFREEWPDDKIYKTLGLTEIEIEFLENQVDKF